MNRFTLFLGIILVLLTLANASVLSEKNPNAESLVRKEPISFLEKLVSLVHKKKKKDSGCRDDDCDDAIDDDDDDDDDDGDTDDDTDDEESDEESDDESDYESDDDDSDDSDSEDDDESDDDEPEESEEPTETDDPLPVVPASCPTGYTLSGTKCILSGAPSSLSATLVPATVCPRGFFLTDELCVKGSKTKNPKCPKSTKKAKSGTCYSCEGQGKPTSNGKCQLPKAMIPICPDGYELKKTAGIYIPNKGALFGERLINLAFVICMSWCRLLYE